LGEINEGQAIGFNQQSKETSNPDNVIFVKTRVLKDDM
jgi:hypothetical protein